MESVHISGLTLIKALNGLQNARLFGVKCNLRTVSLYSYRLSTRQFNAESLIRHSTRAIFDDYKVKLADSIRGGGQHQSIKSASPPQRPCREHHQRSMHRLHQSHVSLFVQPDSEERPDERSSQQRQRSYHIYVHP